MVLLTLDSQGIAVFPFESDPPRAVNGERESLGGKSKSVQVELFKPSRGGPARSPGCPECILDWRTHSNWS